jgi:hypothetical protein
MIYVVMKDFAAPVATIIAAFSAVGVTGYFAFRQWQTAREQSQTARKKLLLDLFDKRFAVYDELRSAMSRHLGSSTDQTAFLEFARASSRAGFVFGPEVQTFLEDRRNDLDRGTTLRSLVSQPIPEGREAAAAELAALLRRLADFFRDFDQLVAPYMSHHQKAD